MVDKVAIARLTADRFLEWTKKLIAQDATPVVVLGMQHGPGRNDVVLCCDGTWSTKELAQLLRITLLYLEAAQTLRN